MKTRQVMIAAAAALSLLLASGAVQARQADFALQLPDKTTVLTARSVKAASVINDVIGQPALLIELTPEGAAELSATAKAHPGASVTVMIAGKPAAPPTTLQGGAGQMIVREVGDADQAANLAASLNAIKAR